MFSIFGMFGQIETWQPRATATRNFVRFFQNFFWHSIFHSQSAEGSKSAFSATDINEVAIAKAELTSKLFQHCLQRYYLKINIHQNVILNDWLFKRSIPYSEKSFANEILYGFANAL
jgi:hypothetical protein